jgi:hypothetical protein
LTERADRNRLNVSTNINFRSTPEIANHATSLEINQKIASHSEKGIPFINSHVPDFGISHCQSGRLAKIRRETNHVKGTTVSKDGLAKDRKCATRFE